MNPYRDEHPETSTITPSNNARTWYYHRLSLPIPEAAHMTYYLMHVTAAEPDKRETLKASSTQSVCWCMSERNGANATDRVGAGSENYMHQKRDPD